MQSRTTSIESQSAESAFARALPMQVLSCSIGALAYIRTIGFAFVYDDAMSIVRPYSPQYGGSGGAPVSGQVALIRPVTGWWMRLNHELFGLHPSGWHGMMIVLHVLVTYLVVATVYRLLQSRRLAFFASAVFAVHPSHVENVAWVSAVNDLLMSAALLCSFIAYLKSRERRSTVWRLCAAGLFLPALFTKETAVVFPAMILAYSYIVSKERSSLKRAQEGIRESVPFFLVLAMYFVLRVQWVKGAVAAPVHDVLPWKTILLTWPAVLWFEVRHLVFPTVLSEFYSSEYVVQLASKAFLLPLIALAGLAVCTGLVLRRLKNRKLSQFACVWIIVPLVPTLYLRALTPNDFLHDRFLYFPSIGFALLLVLVIDELFDQVVRDRRLLLQTYVFCVVIVLSAVGCVFNEGAWANDISLYQRGLKSAPQNLVVKDNLANELIAKGRFDEAIGLYRDVLAHDPTNSLAKDNLANALAIEGHSTQAIELYREVIAQDPKFWTAYYNLARELLTKGEFGDAEQVLQQSIAVNDKDAQQFIFLALAQQRLNKLNEAAKNAQIAIGKSPQHPGYHAVLAGILEATGDRQRAIAELKAELSINPRNKQVAVQLERLQSRPN